MNMEKKGTRILLAVALGLCMNLWSQESGISRANQKYDTYSFKPAIDIYQRVLDKGYKSADLLQRLGNSYYFNAEYSNAGKVYEELIVSYPDETGPEYFFRYSHTLKSLGQNQEADRMMNRFYEMTGGVDSRGAAFANNRNYRAEIERNSGRYEVAPFMYNSVYNEFAPTLYKNGLIFSSDRDTGNLRKDRHTWTASQFLDLYKINVDSASDAKVLKIKDLSSKIHESTSVATADGKTLYFTRNNLEDSRVVRDQEGIVRLKIYSAEWQEDKGEWGNIRELPFNDDNYSVAHPALSPDEQTLYFASDMPGSVGASDIFKVAILGNGSYGAPKHLGENINTEGRETFPFVSSAGNLYFSSDGHPGLGGLDIFGTRITDGDYTRRVINVGRPVNSPKDDMTFVFTEDTKRGYFASNREESRGGDDIYSFIENRPLVFECVQLVEGTVRDKITNTPLVGATVMVIDEDNDEILSVLTDFEGKFKLQLDCDQGNFVRALTEGYIPAEEYLARSEGKPQIIDFYLEREEVIAGFGDDLAKLLQLSTIYFDFDRYNIRPDAEVELQKVIAAMEKYPSLRIKANSHTDSRGPAAYNLWLSGKRAESTVNYMVSKGISRDRLTSEGFGESRLQNRCTDGVRCSEAQHQLNRRSEFIIQD